MANRCTLRRDSSASCSTSAATRRPSSAGQAAITAIPAAPRAHPAPAPALDRAPRREALPRLGTVDALRGVAAAAVVWYHLTRIEIHLLPVGTVRMSGRFGWLGVDMFFVISGFVLPWSLWRARYTLRSFGRFVARRIVRLDPPYLASVLLVLVLAAAAPLLPAGSTRSPITPLEVALHLGYANVFAGQRWLNPVYWTLAIEVQWYLLVGVLMPLVAADTRRARVLLIAALCVAALLPDLPGAPLRSLIFPFLGLFVMGIGAFQRHARLLSRSGLAAVLAAGAMMTTYRVGSVAAAAGVVTAVLIAEADLKPRALLWLGEISYSLYLVHAPVSTLFLHYAVDHDLGIVGRYVMMASAAVTSLAVAWLMARFVERPARALASRIRYAHHRPRSVVARANAAPTPTSVAVVGG